MKNKEKELMVNKNILFKKVCCKAYYKKVCDGKYIQEVDTEKGKSYFLANSNEPESQWKETSTGESGHFKTYFERKEKAFNGIVVGFKWIVLTGWVEIEHNDNPYNEYDYVCKTPNIIGECAIVYFANNRKRYVPLDSLEVMRNE